jgi:hypothetical protein
MSRYRREYNPQELGHLSDRDLLWKVLELQVITLEELESTKEIVMATQLDVDALADAVTKGVVDISAEIAALKSANPSLDLSGLTAAVNTLTDLDQVNAPPVV